MDYEIPDVSQINLDELEVKPFPSRVEYRISINKRAYEAIVQHADEDTQVELCGVLIGNVYKDEKGPFLDITDIITGEHASSDGAQVTFTHDTWAHINAIKDTKFPDNNIVGWYHTHPQYGIFLSQQDRFIHENFFNQPWQTAFVIDPILKQEGFFVWHDGTPSIVDEFWLDGEERGREDSDEGADVPEKTKLPAEDESAKRGSVEKRPYGDYIFVGIIALFALFAVYLIGDSVAYNRAQKTFQIASDVQQQQLARTYELYEGLKHEVANLKQGSDKVNEAITDISNKLTEHDNGTKNSIAAINADVGKVRVDISQTAEKQSAEVQSFHQSIVSLNETAAAIKNQFFELKKQFADIYARRAMSVVRKMENGDADEKKELLEEALNLLSIAAEIAPENKAKYDGIANELIR